MKRKDLGDFFVECSKQITEDFSNYKLKLAI